MIKQIFIPYWKWECYKNKMYNKITQEEEIYKRKLCSNLLNNTNEFSLSMENVINSWKYTMINHLSNKSINRKAFVGQCAAYYKYQIPEYITRDVWKTINKKKCILANNEAIKHIEKWEYNRKLKNILKFGNQDVIIEDYQMRLQFK
jgi:hypothetical protein